MNPDMKTMTIEERLRSRSARSQGGADKLDDEAADEINRLRRELDSVCLQYKSLSEDAESLRAKLIEARADRWEKALTGRQGNE